MSNLNITCRLLIENICLINMRRRFNCLITFPNFLFDWQIYMRRDHFVHAPSQPKTTLHSLIGWAHIQNDDCMGINFFSWRTVYWDMYHSSRTIPALYVFLLHCSTFCVNMIIHNSLNISVEVVWISCDLKLYDIHVIIEVLHIMKKTNRVCTIIAQSIWLRHLIMFGSH